MKPKTFGKAWVRAHWKTDTKRHWPKRSTGAPHVPVEKRAPHGPVEHTGAKRPMADSTHRRNAPSSTDVDRSAVFKRPVGPELVSDFKKRLAALRRFQDTGKVYSVIGAAPSHQSVRRSPKKR